MLFRSWFAYFAPIRTPPDILARLVGEFSIATTTPAFRERMRAAGMFAIAEGPVALARTLRDELHHWGRVMRSVDFTAHR